MNSQVQELSVWYGVVLSAVAATLLFVVFLAWRVLQLPTGTDKMRAIAQAIQEGASAYLKKQYTVIGIVGLIASFVLEYFSGWHVAVGFAAGAALSGLAGFCGMHVSVRANIRTAQSATESMQKAFSTAIYAGAVTGFLVKGLAMLGLLPILYWLVSEGGGRMAMETLVALSFGASLISIFARLGGGIFTKGADVGADLVGKVESQIPEDDPRNPAVIADNVGDNVGDCAGMAADLFETYVVTLSANVLIGCAIEMGTDAFAIYPLFVGALASFASIIGMAFVSLRGTNIMRALYNGLFVSAVLAVIFIFFGTQWLTQTDMGILAVNSNFSLTSLMTCVMLGLLLTLTLVWITEFYTSERYRPVRSIASASEQGHATNIIQGLAVSLEATVVPVLLISVTIILAYINGGLYGLAVAATTMLSFSGVIIALDAYGPITDNAGGIAEMSGMQKEVRKITDALDAVGNTTKAVTKGYAIGSAALAALVIFAVYVYDMEYYLPHMEVKFLLTDPYTIVGLLIGGMLPFAFASLSMTAVGRVGGAVVREVRRQFKENPGILTGKTKPDYGQAVSLLTQDAIYAMVLPSLLPILAPVAVFYAINSYAGMSKAFLTIGALVLGVTITGVLLGLSMTSGGGAWDNAKKYIEDGVHGGKNSPAHAAAVTGDTVGDPYKDTAGPAINPMIKIVNIVAILLLMIAAKI